MLTVGRGRVPPVPYRDPGLLWRVARRVAPRWAARRRWAALEEAGLSYGTGVRRDESVIELEEIHDNPLHAYYEAYSEGPGMTKPRQYFKVYHRYLGPFVGRSVNVVEIGVFSGGSTRMWRDYFGERAIIHGVDIDEECRRFAADRIHIHIGDQSDPDFWAEFSGRVPEIDVVIDDGGHEPRHQIPTLEALLPRIRPGGVYICEDIGGADNPFQAYLAGLTRNLHSLALQIDEHRTYTTGLQQLVESVHFYPFIAVIKKPERPIGQFFSDRRGTDWVASA
jgi:hypothetical protein